MRLEKQPKRPEFTDHDCQRVIATMRVKKCIEDTMILRAQLQDVYDSLKALNTAQREGKP